MSGKRIPSPEETGGKIDGLLIASEIVLNKMISIGVEGKEHGLLFELHGKLMQEIDKINKEDESIVE